MNELDGAFDAWLASKKEAEALRAESERARLAARAATVEMDALCEAFTELLGKGRCYVRDGKSYHATDFAGYVPVMDVVEAAKEEPSRMGNRWL